MACARAFNSDHQTQLLLQVQFVKSVSRLFAVFPRFPAILAVHLFFLFHEVRKSSDSTVRITLHDSTVDSINWSPQMI